MPSVATKARSFMRQSEATGMKQVRVLFKCTVCAVVVPMLVGCPPPQYGIFGRSHLDAEPNSACIQSVLNAQEPDEPLMVNALADKDTMTKPGQQATQPRRNQLYSFSVAGRRYGVQIIKTPDHPVEYRHYAFAEEKTPANELQGMRAQLRNIAHGIQEQCRAEHLLERLQQECRGTSCDAPGANAG